MTEKQAPDYLKHAVTEYGSPISTANIQTFKMYSRHLTGREAIRINMDGLKKVIKKHEALEQNERTVARKRQLVSLKQSLTSGSNSKAGLIVSHGPKVIPFGAKTGRDTTTGPAINNISKQYWHRFMTPPRGSAYLLLDFEQQEPVIAALKAGNEKLLEMYKQADIYDELNIEVANGMLNRSQFKILFLSHIYGCRAEGIAEALAVPLTRAKQWVSPLKKVISPIDYWLDGEMYRAIRKGEVRSLDWRMAVSEKSKKLSVRNWPIQATGADIMRRACFNLDKANIPLLLTNHDSFLVRLEESNLDHQLALAKKALIDASAEVLDGFRLKVKVELHIPSDKREKNND